MIPDGYRRCPACRVNVPVDHDHTIGECIELIVERQAKNG